MACPGCGCKTTYLYDEGDDLPGGDERLYRCAACGSVFDVEDEAPEEDDEPASHNNPWKADIDAQTNPASAGDPGLF